MSPIEYGALEVMIALVAGSLGAAAGILSDWDWNEEDEMRELEFGRAELAAVAIKAVIEDSKNNDPIDLFKVLVTAAASLSVDARMEDLEAMDAFMAERARIVASHSGKVVELAKPASSSSSSSAIEAAPATPREGTPAPAPAAPKPLLPSKHERESFGGPTPETAAKLWKRD